MLTQETAALFDGEDGVIDGFVQPHLAWSTSASSIKAVNETSSSGYISEAWIGTAGKAKAFALTLVHIFSELGNMGLEEGEGANVMFWEDGDLGMVALVMTGDSGDALEADAYEEAEESGLIQVLFDGNDNSPHELFQEPFDDQLKTRLRKFIMDKWQPE